MVRRPCLLILTRDWSIGGAERQVVELLKVIDKRSIDICAATFYGTGPLRRELQGLPGVRLWNLRKRGRWDVVPFLLRAVRLARRVRPDVIHGYQGFPNLLTLILGWVTGARTVWGMRASNMDMRRYDWLRQRARCVMRSGPPSFFSRLQIKRACGKDARCVSRHFFRQRL